MTASVRCPDCGATTRLTNDDGATAFVCSNDECPRVFVQVRSPRPSIERATDRLAHDLDKIYDVLP